MLIVLKLYLKFWAPGAGYSHAPNVSYTVKNGSLATTFDDGQTDVVIGEFSIFIEMRHNGKTAYIQNVNSGTFIVIQSRRKRSVTVAQCQAACTSVSAVLKEQCEYDCLTMEDTEVGEAHSSVVEVEAEVVVDDSQVEIWLPDLDYSTTTPASASNLIMSTSLFVVTALAMLW